MNDFWESRRVLVTGGSGFLGRNLISFLKLNGCTFYNPTRAELDLSSLPSTLRYIHTHPCDLIFHLAAKVGGIGDVSRNPFPYISENITMALNLVESVVSVRDYRTKIVFAGSVCAYPLETPMPMMEDDLWNGRPEPTNGPYGVAKRTIQTLAEAATDQYGIPTAYALLANMYGPGDRYDPETSHAIPAIILKMHQAQIGGSKTITLWGSGKPTRDFLYVEDACYALIRMAMEMGSPSPINIGSGVETSIAEVAEQIRRRLGWNGEIVWDTSRPDGQPRRILDVSKAKRLLGWQPSTSIRDGIQSTVSDYMRRMGVYSESRI